jgi:hypothetical protein
LLHNKYHYYVIYRTNLMSVRAYRLKELKITEMNYVPMIRYSWKIERKFVSWNESC